jgi:uncharacterized protein YoaH (UPF0181 family)
MRSGERRDGLQKGESIKTEANELREGKQTKSMKKESRQKEQKLHNIKPQHTTPQNYTCDLLYLGHH